MNYIIITQLAYLTLLIWQARQNRVHNVEFRMRGHSISTGPGTLAGLTEPVVLLQTNLWKGSIYYLVPVGTQSDKVHDT